MLWQLIPNLVHSTEIPAMTHYVVAWMGNTTGCWVLKLLISCCTYDGTCLIKNLIFTYFMTLDKWLPKEAYSFAGEFRELGHLVIFSDALSLNAL
jgi:hypothetical protein